MSIMENMKIWEIQHLQTTQVQGQDFGETSEEINPLLIPPTLLISPSKLMAPLC